MKTTKSVHEMHRLNQFIDGDIVDLDSEGLQAELRHHFLQKGIELSSKLTNLEGSKIMVSESIKNAEAEHKANYTFLFSSNPWIAPIGTVSVWHNNHIEKCLPVREVCKCKDNKAMCVFKFGTYTFIARLRIN